MTRAPAPPATDPLLFVYGTLRRASRHPMHALVGRACRYVDAGWVRGRLYDLGEYPGLVHEPAAAQRVLGELWRLPPAHADVLLALDEYEGCGPADPQPHEYARLQLSVERAGSTPVSAWVYVLAGPLPRGAIAIASGDWLQR